MLNLPSGYKGPYKTPNMNTDSAIETPDKYTIVFHMKKPFAAFDYLAQQPNTMPVPKDKDKGAKYRKLGCRHRSVQVCRPAARQELQSGSQ
jgi:peptide/nickel transport system substrate-binding protein